MEMSLMTTYIVIIIILELLDTQVGVEMSMTST
jgi:hypothetical protein